MSEWFCRIDGVVIGPCRAEELRGFHLSGKLMPESLIREGTMGVWQNYRERFPVETQMPRARTLQYDGRDIKFACPVCSQHYLGDVENFCGGRLICTYCGSAILIPGREEAEREARTAALTEHSIEEGTARCPHCFKRFSREDMLAISTHPQLTGDPVAGEFAPRRFVPELFNSDGIPLDAMGELAPDRACPHCHLRLPESLGSRDERIFSLVGAPASGKSYYLTILTHLLLDRFQNWFGRTLLNADPALNAQLDECIRTLFLPPDPQQMVMLPKTQPAGEGFTDRVFLNGAAIDLPKPFVYSLSKSARATEPGEADFFFYDNAGEHFQPVASERNHPATRHLGLSDGIVFLVDPSGDANWRTECSASDPQIALPNPKLTDQSVLFAEMIDRIRRHRNQGCSRKVPIPLVVVLAKSDLLFDRNAALRVRTEDFLRFSDDRTIRLLDRQKILSLSREVRQLFERHIPSLVTAAESCFEEVIYLPVSNFGIRAERDAVSGGIGVRPGELCSCGAELPFLFLLAKLGYLNFVPDDDVAAGLPLNPGGA